MPNKLFFEHVLEYIQQGKYITICVKGHSMRPFLREGDKVLLKPFELKELTRGIIVLAKMNDQILLHRVVKYDKATIWLAGDGNLVVHELVNYSDVIAIVVSLYDGEREVRLNQGWRRDLGNVWYLIRPLRRIVRKLY